MELLDHCCQGTSELAQPSLENQTVQLEIERPTPWVGVKAGDRLRRLLGHLLDVHAALGREHQDVGPRVAVDGEAEIDLPFDLER